MPPGVWEGEGGGGVKAKQGNRPNKGIGLQPQEKIVGTVVTIYTITVSLNST